MFAPHRHVPRCSCWKLLGVLQTSRSTTFQRRYVPSDICCLIKICIAARLRCFMSTLPICQQHIKLQGQTTMQLHVCVHDHQSYRNPNMLRLFPNTSKTTTKIPMAHAMALPTLYKASLGGVTMTVVAGLRLGLMPSIKHLWHDSNPRCWNNHTLFKRTQALLHVHNPHKQMCNVCFAGSMHTVATTKQQLEHFPWLHVS